MSVPEVVRSPAPSTPPSHHAARLERQLQAERNMVRAGIKALFVSLPLFVGVLVGMMAIAMAGKQPWYVWVSLGAGMGVYASLFLGSVGAVLVASQKLDQVDADD